MEINDVRELLSEFHEIGFDYHNQSYLISAFGVKPFFKKARIEYWFFPSEGTGQEAQKFDKIEDIFNVEIQGKALREILNEIEITEIY